MLRFTALILCGLLIVTSGVGCKQPDQIPPKGDVGPAPPAPTAGNMGQAGDTVGGGGTTSADMSAPEPPL